MTTVVDTNILIAVWDKDETLSKPAAEAVTQALTDGRVICPAPVYAELMALPTRTEAFLDAFFHDSGIRVDWHLPEPVWRAAGAAFQRYAKRRHRAAGAPRRILADFLIGAYAAHHRAHLLTLDQKLYRAAFPNLPIVRV
jgi:predicted nucleic acid-binding protein